MRGCCLISCDSEYSPTYPIIIEMFFFLCFLVIMILNIVFYTQMKSIKNSYVDFSNYISCGDDSFNEAVALFINNLDNVFGLSFINLIVSVIIFILPLTVFFLNLCCKACCSHDYQTRSNNLVNQGPTIKNKKNLNKEIKMDEC